MSLLVDHTSDFVWRRVLNFVTLSNNVEHHVTSDDEKANLYWLTKPAQGRVCSALKQIFRMFCCVKRPHALVLLALSLPLFASTPDTFSIKEVNGTTTTNYPVQMGRPIADNEILHYPQVGICTDSTCGTVSSWLTTQADVKQRWASGYVKHAILSFYIPTLTASSTVYLKIQDQSICNCGTGETKANMLANYNFDAVESFTANSITATASARTMLSAWDGSASSPQGPVYKWVNGSIATTLILDDNATATYDIGFKDKAVTAVAADTSSASTTIPVLYGGDIVAGNILQFSGYGAAEEVCVGSVSGNTVTTGTGCTGTASSNGRGWNGTGASTARQGFVATIVGASSPVWEAAPNSFYKSIHPSFEVTFWPSKGIVSVSFVAGIVNSEHMEDQIYNLSLSLGNTSPSVVYTQSGITQGVAQRWRVKRNNQSGQTWSVSTADGSTTIAKETWIGGTPTPIAVNHNLAYLTATYFVPNYDTSFSILDATISSLWSAVSGSDAVSSAINSRGGVWIAMGSAGADPWIGPLPNWVTEWLYSGDIRSQEAAYLLSDEEGMFSEHVLEATSGKNLLRTDTPGAGTGVGHVLSVTNRKTIFNEPGYRWLFSTTNSDNIHAVGVNDTGTTYLGDFEHEPDFGSAMYAVTGDFWYLQEEMYSASWYPSVPNYADPSSPQGRGPTGAEGGVWDDDVRTIGWYFRTESTAQFIMPDTDFTPEKTYFTTMIEDDIAQEEGARCGAGDILSWCSSSPFHGNANWVWGYQVRATVNNEDTGNQGTSYPTLHQWFAGNWSFVESDPGEYGIAPDAPNAIGSITTSGTSTTATLSNSTDCSNLKVNQMIWMYPDNGASPGTGLARTVVRAVSCPSITMNDALALTHGGGSWGYTTVAQSAISQFSSDYLAYSLGRAYELGIRSGNLLNWFGTFFTGLINDAGSNPRLAFTGRMPVTTFTTGVPGSYISTYSQLKSAYTTGWQNLSSGYDPSGTPTNSTLATGYSSYARAAYSMLTNVSGGSTAWTWFQNNVNNNTAVFQTDPTWALLPRSFSAPACVINTTTLPSVNTGSAYSQTLSQSNCNASSWTITSGSLTGSGLSLSSGAISGTAATAGTYSFTVSYDTASQPLSITVTTPGTITPVMIDGALKLGGSAIFRF